MSKASQFKNILRPIISEPIYELSNRNVFEEIVFSWLDRENQSNRISFLSISKWFLKATTPVFLMEQVNLKVGILPDQEAIKKSLSEIFSDNYKLDNTILSVLSWGRFSISIDINETKISIDLSKLLHLAFGENIYREMKAVFSCLRHSEKSEILKQIQINDFQSGESLRKLFQKDAEALKNGNRNDEKLQKFLERMEWFWALAKDSFPTRRYS